MLRNRRDALTAALARELPEWRVSRTAGRDLVVGRARRAALDPADHARGTGRRGRRPRLAVRRGRHVGTLPADPVRPARRAPRDGSRAAGRRRGSSSIGRAWRRGSSWLHSWVITLQFPVLGVDDMDRAVRFWSELLGYQVREAHRTQHRWCTLDPVSGDGSSLALQLSSTPVQAVAAHAPRPGRARRRRSAGGGGSGVRSRRQPGRLGPVARGSATSSSSPTPRATASVWSTSTTSEVACPAYAGICAHSVPTRGKRRSQRASRAAAELITRRARRRRRAPARPPRPRPPARPAGRTASGRCTRASGHRAPRRRARRPRPASCSR